jgi:hypothetical protein
VLTAAMRAHPAAEWLQQNCGFALGSLAISEEHRAAIAAAGGIDVLTAAMRGHPAAEGVQQGCGFALRRLAWSEEHHPAIAGAGGIGVLIAAMRAHPTAEGVQEECGIALRRLAWSEERRAAILAAGGRVLEGRLGWTQPADTINCELVPGKMYQVGHELPAGGHVKWSVGVAAYDIMVHARFVEKKKMGKGKASSGAEGEGGEASEGVEKAYCKAMKLMDSENGSSDWKEGLKMLRQLRENGEVVGKTSREEYKSTILFDQKRLGDSCDLHRGALICGSYTADAAGILQIALDNSCVASQAAHSLHRRVAVPPPSRRCWRTRVSY